ncbi:phosphotransferase [Anaerophilus nitritogenes]|uniref:phosphotransferase n=1 Tax=Anaerophilus nitritogenes TaxID=2498136 RepID=UPI00101CA08E|nr:phosphotransferase [Anaerophilus nitritogenes]
MNIYKFDVMNTVIKEGYTNQRSIAEVTNYSLGKVNSAVRTLVDEQYLDDQLTLTEKALKEIHRKKPKNAIILAAGFGMRMVPINMEFPKGLLKIHEEPLIERIIYQLHKVGIYNVDIVVGFMKEKYEYLIDKYGVNLVYNPDYALKNNIHSLNLVVDKISNTYIIPCDIWAERNPFSNHELYSWYSVSDIVDDESTVRINRKMELVSVEEGKAGNTMIGISYLLEEEASIVRDKIKKFCSMKKYDKSFWEEALFDKVDKMVVYARVYKADQVFEINTYEQLRELDENSEHLNSDSISLIAMEMKVTSVDIQDISVLKKGMTNCSFRFSCKDKKYIMRVPGKGTDKLINRRNEYEVYRVLKEEGISDKVIYISPDTGYKITEFLDNARVCDPFNINDVKLCMKFLRKFHESKLNVEHTFDIFKQIEFYESLWDGKPSIFVDYSETKKKVKSLKPIIESLPRDWTLTHIDAVPDNFLVIDDEVCLIDWEYAGMQDPHVDIAMFAIYSMYDREYVELLIDSYFIEGCPEDIRIKIYCYIAVCSLLWNNWCEYKRFCGVEFGEYSLKQYRYAKEYYNIVQEELVRNKMMP